MRIRIALVVLGPLLVTSAACQFFDPNKPPSVPQDTCVLERGGVSADGTLWYEVDGPAPDVDVDVDGNGVLGDFVTHFTGPAWSNESAACRAEDMFFGATPTNAFGQYFPFVVDGREMPPSSTLGYCIVNKENSNEYVMYAAAGNQSAGLGACESTLPGAADVSAEWHNCPGAELCPPAPKDECFLSEGDGNGYGVVVNVDDVACTSNARGDHEDTIVLNVGSDTGSAFGTDSAACITQNPWDSGGSVFGRSAIKRTSKVGAGEIGDFSTRAPEVIPTGALGYCLMNAAARTQYAVFAMCADALPVEPPPAMGDAGVSDAGAPMAPAAADPTAMLQALKDRCDAATRPEDADDGTQRSTEAPAMWVDCPGGPLCM